MLDRAHLLIALALLTAATGAACTKTEDGKSSGTMATTGTAPTSMPSASASAAMAMPEHSATAAMSASAAPSASVAAATSGSTTTAKNAPPGSASAVASAGPAECGTKPLPDCPLQAWMKANTNPAIASNDLPALATALDKAAGFAPPGYTNWASIAKDGAKAAKGGDMTAAKASCRTCHDQYKEKYKKEMRARKI